MKRLGAAIVLGICLALPVGASADPVVNENIYQWVQSTARQSYFFNKAVMCFGVKKDGTINLDELIVPCLHQYDQIQREDVLAKRRWKGLSMRGYSNLYGSAKYLLINTKKKTVTVTRTEDLDNTWAVLSSVTDSKPRDYTKLSEKNVDRKFYDEIIKYAHSHGLELAKRTKGKLLRKDLRRLEKMMPPGVHLTTKQERDQKR